MRSKLERAPELVIIIMERVAGYYSLEFLFLFAKQQIISPRLHIGERVKPEVPLPVALG